ncbi:MAG: hypothetical protein VKK04_09075 [Synechococcales bacterium]|nr:hypothetical protein [Synechococcales bacterium]
MLIQKIGLLLGLVSTTAAVSLSGGQALAQIGEPDTSQDGLNTEDNYEDSYDYEISDEGMEILCDRFPLNSRCEGMVGGEDGPLRDERTEPSVFDESPSAPDEPSEIDDTGADDPAEFPNQL